MLPLGYQNIKKRFTGGSTSCGSTTDIEWKILEAYSTVENDYRSYTHQQAEAGTKQTR